VGDLVKRQLIYLKKMAKNIVQTFRAKTRKKRKGVHSKNASKGQTGYKKKYKGQGKQR
jgi:hypothetical protein